MKPGDYERWINEGAYPGGKGSTYQHLISRMPPHETYIEAFLGGGAVMRKKRAAARNIGLDLDRDVIERWSCPLMIAEMGAAFPPAAPLDSPATAAAARVTGTISHDRQRRAGLRRWTAPTRNASSRAALSAGDLASFEFHQADAIQFLRDYPYTGTELVYCDPPYLHATRGRADLYQHEMTTAQHRELLGVLRGLPCMVMISGYASALYTRELARWHSFTFQAQTRCGVATEYVWHNYPPPIELHDYRYLGRDRRERERLKRKQKTWARRLSAMPALERQALYSVLSGAIGEAPARDAGFAGARGFTQSSDSTLSAMRRSRERAGVIDSSLFASGE